MWKQGRGHPFSFAVALVASESLSVLFHLCLGTGATMVIVAAANFFSLHHC